MNFLFSKPDWFRVLLLSALALRCRPVEAVPGQTLVHLVQDTLYNLRNEDNSNLVYSSIVAFLLMVLLQRFYRHRAMLCYGMPVMTHPPQGRPWPFLGHALNFLSYRPWDLLMSWHNLYGPIVCFDLLGSTMFSLASPSLLKLVLQSKIQSVKKDISNTMKHFIVILGTGIVTSENQSWIKQRLKMSHPLRVEVLEMIPRQTLLAVQRWMTKLDAACETQESVEVGSSLRHLTLQVISGTFLSLSAEESDSTFAKMYLPIVDESNLRVWHPYRAYLFMLPVFWKYLWNVHNLNRYVSHLIRVRWLVRQQERINGGSVRTQDILDGVLKAHEKEFPHQMNLPEMAVRQFRDEMKTFMLAGHETSAAMMTWTLYELLANTALMQRVSEEGASLFARNVDWSRAGADELPSNDQLKHLILSEACLRESLRKYSVVPIVARRTVEDLYLEDGKYFIPKGSSFLINIQAIHHDPNLWPNPMRFDPDRFVDGEIVPYTFLPFIAGPRNCLGQHLALLESKMVISLLAQRYIFSLGEGATLEVDDWENDKDPRHRFMVPVVPKEELKVTVQRK
jgi:cytochrome P450